MLRNTLQVIDPNSAVAEFGITLIDTYLHTFAVLTELKRNTGMSVTDAASHYINEVSACYGLEPKNTVYVAKYEGRNELVRLTPLMSGSFCISVKFSLLPDRLGEFILQNMRAF